MLEIGGAGVDLYSVSGIRRQCGVEKKRKLYATSITALIWVEIQHFPNLSNGSIQADLVHYGFGSLGVVC